MAMLFSCLAHFSWWLEPAYPRTAAILSEIGMVATPTFLLLSGAMTGLLCSGISTSRLQIKYLLLNRGLFLMIIGHALIALAEAHRNGGILRTLSGSSIVDEIGLAMVLAAFAVQPLAQERIRRATAAAAGGIFLLAWIATLIWQPRSGWQLTVKQALFGPNVFGPAMRTYTAPTLQYLAVYAIGLPIGAAVRRNLAGPEFALRTATSLTKWSTLMVSAALVIRALRWGADRGPLHIPYLPYLDISLSISSKLPPSPAYLVFYAGIGILLSGALFYGWHSRSISAHNLIRWLAIIGRASLFCFVLQYFLLWTLPDWLGVEPSSFAAFVFLGNVAILWIAAYGWTRLRCLAFGPLSLLCF
jgi:hypothetical protein